MMEHKRVCVIAVHPDDETLGCGGTILKHISNDDEVICVFVTAGNRAQRNLISTASKAYNFTKVFKFDLPELDIADLSLNKIIPIISEVFKTIEPQNNLYSKPL